MDADDRAVLRAAQDLKDAVHALGAQLTSTAVSADELARLTAAVTELTASVDGPDRAPYWEAGEDELARYRHRSMFVGDLHLGAPSATWEDRPGPGGTPGYALTTTWSNLFQGAPNTAHGGWVAGTFDELLGGVQGLAANGGGFTGRLMVRYRSLTPLNEPLVFHGWIVEERTRRTLTRATCHAGDRLTAEAEALFIRGSVRPQDVR